MGARSRQKFWGTSLVKDRILHSKNGHTRSLPIRGLALDLLRSLPRSSLGFIFPSKNRLSPMTFRRSTKTAIQRAGIKNFRPHDWPT